MEPVIYPATITPVAHPDRIKRPESGRDKGKESPFTRYLRRRQEDPDGHDPPEDENAGRDPTASAESRDSGRVDATGEGPVKKLIDVRV